MYRSEAQVYTSLNDRVSSLLLQVKYKRIVENVDRERVYRLRYDCYLREGAIAPRTQPLLSDEFDNRSNTHVIGLEIEGKIVASIRIHILTLATSHSPTMSAFRDLLFPFLEQGQTLVDPSRFVVDPDAAKAFPDLQYMTLRLPFIAAGYFHAEAALAAVRSEHMPFYTRVLRFSKIAEPREYLQLTKPLGLMIS